MRPTPDPRIEAINVATLPAALVGCSAEEWQTRCDLAALYRLVAHHRWTDFVYTHISARLPGPDHHFLINKYGVLFHQEVRASDLVKIDMHGNVVEDGDTASRRVNADALPSTPRFTWRARILSAWCTPTPRPGSPSPACGRDCCRCRNMPLKFYGRLAYHGYEGIALDLDEHKRLVRDLGQHKAMILRNHGLLVGGRLNCPRRSTRFICWNVPAPRRWRRCRAGANWCCRRPRCASIRRNNSPCRTRRTATPGCGNQRCV